MTVNLHTHTFLCHHASGTPMEYAERACENGIKTFGFSDHAPFIDSKGHQMGYRVPMEQFDEYVSLVEEVKRAFDGKMEVLTGLEMEYYPEHFEEMLSIYKKAGIQYVILGQHFAGSEENDAVYTGAPNDDEQRFLDYVSSVVEGIKTGVYTYVAHPDVINFTGDRELYKREMRKICRTAAEYQLPLEINFLGIRGNRQYPNEDFWRMAGEEKCLAVYGFDAHTTQDAFDGDSIARADEIVKNYGLTLVETPIIKYI